MCLYIDDVDGYEFLRDGSRRARKQHRCDECGRTIEAGEQYRFWIGIQDGDLSEQKMCANCWAVIDVAAEMTGCPRYWYWGQVYELQNGEDGDFLGDILANHDLTRRQQAWVRLCAHHGKRRWTRPDGGLYDVPELVAA